MPEDGTFLALPRVTAFGIVDGMPGRNARRGASELIQRSMQDEDLRRRLLEYRKSTVEQERGAKLPEGIEVQVIEETPETIYLVLPPKAETSQDGGELSDRELEAVAGGW